MEKYLSRKEAASWLTDHGLRISWQTLQKMACVGGGPSYQLFGGRAVYLEKNLVDYALLKLTPPRHSTSGTIPPNPQTKRKAVRE
jgi:hypothetical protein